jgi:S-adenosylmethionine:tRNA ribosyltransferase-isomerase
LKHPAGAGLMPDAGCFFYHKSILMILPGSINISDYNYDLPADRIAQKPPFERDASRLLVFRDGHSSDEQFSGIYRLIPEGSTLVFNDTKVVRARLIFTKSTGGLIEIFCLEPLTPSTDLQMAFSQRGSSSWSCLVGNSKKWKNEILVMHADDKGGWLKAERKASLGDGCFEIAFSWAPASLSFSEVLAAAGKVPLPPYIIREPADDDIDRYQTVYAKHEGSVAAPTAGLHFTKAILKRLEAGKCMELGVTLHVGLGTFRPVNVADIREHIMHREAISVELSTLKALKSRLGHPVIAVGTTSARTLESLYWLGVKALAHPHTETLTVDQWDPYEMASSELPGPAEALDALVSFLESKGLDKYQGSTSLIIVPGYRFRIVNNLITNFHMPQSTLLLLIAAFTGEAWKDAYSHALANNYRFLSYGDACMFFRK